MTERLCEFKEELLDLLYGEGDPAERARLDAHVTECAACAAEVAGLQGVRGTLRAWTPPEMALGFRVVQDPAPMRRWWQAPGWGLAAAATLMFAAGAGLANLEVRYGTDGLLVRTGWRSAAPPAATNVAAPNISAEDLRALENRLRAQFATTALRNPGPATALPAGTQASSVTRIAGGQQSDAELLRRVRALIEESEHRQDRELAFRMTQLVKDFDRQRQADLVRIQAGFGELQGMTGAEVARQRETLNYLMRVSSQRR